MKREEIEAGGEYVTQGDVLVRIEATDNGWGVQKTHGTAGANEWVERKIMGKRYMGTHFQEYQSNPDVRCWVLGAYRPDGSLDAYQDPHKDVVSPRLLTHKRSEHAGVVKFRKSAERTTAQKTKAITDALKKAGITKVKVNLDNNEVTVPLNSLLAALKIEV